VCIQKIVVFVVESAFRGKKTERGREREREKEQIRRENVLSQYKLTTILFVLPKQAIKVPYRTKNSPAITFINFRQYLHF